MPQACSFTCIDPVPGPSWLAAVLVLNAENEDAPEILRAHCASRLAKYKIPRYIWISHEPLPRNASGKFLKRQLRDDLDLNDAV